VEVLLGPLETVSWCPICSQKRLPEQVCLEETRKCGQWFCWCNVFREVFHVCGPAIGKARLPTVDSLLVGTTRRLVPTECRDRRLGRSVTHVKGPRYPGTSQWMTLYVNTVISAR